MYEKTQLKCADDRRPHRPELSRAARALAPCVALLTCIPLYSPAVGQTAERSIGETAETARTLLYDAETRFEYPKAVAALQEALSADPKNASVRLDLAYAHLKIGQTDEAAAVLATLRADTFKLREDERLRLAALEAKASLDTEAEISAWRAYLAQNPDDRWAWYDLAAALSISGSWVESASAAQKAWAAEPRAEKWNASWICYLHSKAHYRVGDYAQASATAKPCLSSDTTRRSTFYRLALADAKLGGEEVIQPLIDQYIEISGADGRNNSNYTLLNIALFHFELGDTAKAAELAEQAWQSENSAYGFWTLIYSLAESGRAEEALRLDRDYGGQYIDNAMVLAAIGWANYRAGDLTASKAHLSQAREVSKRPNRVIDNQLALVERAITAGPNARPAPQLPWLD